MIGVVLAAALLAAQTSEAPASKPEPIDRPEWVEWPSRAEISKFYPKAADRAGMSGAAVIECEVTETGRLENCKVLDDQPIGFGFGEATVRAATTFRIKPRLVDGKPVRATAQLPINWIYPNGSRTRYLQSVVWLEAPTVADVQAAAPKTPGVAYLDCMFETSGRLHDCEIVDERPEASGLGEAALPLAGRFLGAPSLSSGLSVRGARTLIPVRFDVHSDPTVQARLKFAGLPTKSELEQSFPTAASAAGVTAGEARLSCTVGRDGVVTDCAVQGETPAGLGFGEAALALAQKFRVNPWTADGQPVDGLRLDLPFRFRAPGEQVAPVAAKAAP